MNATTTRERELFLFAPPVHGEDLDCPRCGAHRLVEDAEPGLFSCFGCWTWLRRDIDGTLRQVEIPRVETAALALRWRHEALP